MNSLGKYGPVHKMLYGNTSMNAKGKFEVLSMWTALIAMGYVGYVTVKDLRKKGRRRG